MSGHLRHDKQCANCGYTVDIAYCSNCGQKNVETRQSFHHLVAHFAEDLFHYDGAFWKTVKYLFFRPAKLTKDYLSGYRQRFVPPVKLYIFISFVAFLLINISAINNDIEITPMEIANNKKSLEEGYEVNNRKFHSVKELQHYQDSLPDHEKIGWLDFSVQKARINIAEKNVPYLKVLQNIVYTLPKVLFIYMPIFAFWLWLLHGKKRWYFFDHGIFTLHYFSFLLLSITILQLLKYPLTFITGRETAITILGYLYVVQFFYSIFYFFRAHSRMYGEKKYISRLKSVFLFFVNFMSISFVLGASIVYAMITIH